MQDISIQDINSAQHILEQESQPAFLELGQSEKSRDGGLQLVVPLSVFSGESPHWVPEFLNCRG